MCMKNMTRGNKRLKLRQFLDSEIFDYVFSVKMYLFKDSKSLAYI